MPPSPIVAPATPQGVSGPKRTAAILGGVVLLALLAGIAGAFYMGFAQSVWRRVMRAEPLPKGVVDVVKEEYMQSVVMVACLDESGAEWGHGSGVYFLGYEGKPSVETNAHVVLAPDGKFYGCNIYFPRIPDGTFYSAAYFAAPERGLLYHDKKSLIDGRNVEGLDYAILEITEPYKTNEGIPYPFPPAQRDVYETQAEVCKSEQILDLTDEVLMLGYPAVGDKSITVTDGIISGFARDMVKVSATTNQGVSGGIVISPETGCLLGIPTQVAGSYGGGIGFIIASWYKDAFLAGLTGEGTYGSKIATEKLVPYTAPSGVAFVRPEYWAPEPIAQQSTIVKPNSRFELLPGVTLERLEDGNIRAVNPGGVRFSAPPRDIFDTSNANFRFLESEMPGGSLTGAIESVMAGDEFLFGEDMIAFGKPITFVTEEGFPAANFRFVVYSEADNEVHFFDHTVVLGRGRLYQFIFNVHGRDIAGADVQQKYADILEKFKKVAMSIKVR